MDVIAPGMAIFALVFALASFILLLASLIHLLTNKSKSSIDKILWVLVIFMFPVVGPILYFIIGR